MTGLLLVLLAFALIIIEAHLPTYGILGVLAIISLLAGGKLIVDQGGLFGVPLDWPVFIAIAIGMTIVLVIAVRIAIKSLGKKSIAGVEGMIGGHGHVVDWSHDGGRVMVQGELWQAVSPHHHSFKKGDIVEISSVKELVLHIHPKT